MFSCNGSDNGSQTPTDIQTLRKELQRLLLLEEDPSARSVRKEGKRKRATYRKRDDRRGTRKLLRELEDTYK